MESKPQNSSVIEGIKKYNKNFYDVKGYYFEHFYCPILHCDKNSDIIKGHIIPKDLGNSNLWVPQRKDLDNFFGTSLEANLSGIIKERNISPIIKLIDPSLYPKHKPKLYFDGKNLDFFISKKRNTSTPAFVEVASTDGSIIRYLMIKNPPESLIQAEKATLNIVIEKNYLPYVTGALIKSAYLTMFYLMKYNFACSYDSFYIHNILKQFFSDFYLKKTRDINRDLVAFFDKHSGMIKPIIPNDGFSFKGTIIDKKIIMCIGSSGLCFSLGIFVPFGNQLFVVFFPNDIKSSLNTYINFTNDPPMSFKGLICKFNNDDEKNEHWEVNPENEIRFQMANDDFQDKYYASV